MQHGVKKGSWRAGCSTSEQRSSGELDSIVHQEENEYGECD